MIYYCSILDSANKKLPCVRHSQSWYGIWNWGNYKFLCILRISLVLSLPFYKLTIISSQLTRQSKTLHIVRICYMRSSTKNVYHYLSIFYVFLIAFSYYILISSYLAITCLEIFLLHKTTWIGFSTSHTNQVIWN